MMNATGKPYRGKPDVRFDEGTEGKESMEDALVGRPETSGQAGVAWSFLARRFYSTAICQGTGLGLLNRALSP